MIAKSDTPLSFSPAENRDNYDRIFRTITSADWRRAIKRAKTQRNQISDKIRQAIARKDSPKP